MMRFITWWWKAEAPWHAWYMPRSGLVGGAMLGTLLYAIARILL